MALFNVQMSRTRSYEFVIEAKDEDEAFDVAYEAIEDVDDYDLENDGWSAESMYIADDKDAQRWKEEAIKMGNLVKTSDVFW